jgi:toluene monooxygenase system protein B
MLVPLYGFLQGDTLGLLILVRDVDTIAELADNLAQAAAVRVAAPGRKRVFHEGRELDPTLTVARAGLSALDRVDVVAEVA